LRRQRAARNPWILALLVLVGLTAGWQLRHRVFDLRTLADASLEPRYARGATLLVCRLPACLERFADRGLLVGTLLGDAVRLDGGAPGEEVELRPYLRQAAGPLEVSRITLPHRGDTADPRTWGPVEFDALFPLLRDELLDSLKRAGLKDSLLEVEALFLADGRAMLPGELPWKPLAGFRGEFLDRSEMARRSQMVASHRLGTRIDWQRRVLVGDSLLTAHVWRRDCRLLIPAEPGWSYEIAPEDSVKGAVLLAL
jgi:hypothetical protein